MKPPSSATIPRRDVRRDFTSSSESENSEVDPFAEQPKKEFVIPSSVGLRDDEDPSPSQYRVERVREDANQAADEEEEEEAMINSDEDQFQETDPPSAKTGSPMVSSADAVYSKFINMGRQFVVDLEDQRKQD